MKSRVFSINRCSLPPPPQPSFHHVSARFVFLKHTDRGEAMAIAAPGA
jgi:hypothetical protein